jgi:hypothetical protein
MIRKFMAVTEQPANPLSQFLYALKAPETKRQVKFVSAVYRKYGAEIAEILDYRTIAYLGIAKVVKELSQNMIWAQEQGVIGLDEQNYIGFNKAAEIAASKDQKIRHYLGDNFRSSNNRAARNLRDIFREEREFEGGKIIDVSKDKHSELRLRWVPFFASAAGSCEELV